MLYESVLKLCVIAQGPGVVDEVRIETPADEREGEDPTIQVGEPAKETTVTKAPAEAAPTETGTR